LRPHFQLDTGESFCLYVANCIRLVACEQREAIELRSSNPTL
jgi:hypothetical protein